MLMPMKVLKILQLGKRRLDLQPLPLGFVHGLQPDAVMIILPALDLPSRVAGAAFLCMFLIVTVFTMGSYKALLSLCSQALKERLPRITEKVTWASSLIATAIGILILPSISGNLNVAIHGVSIRDRDLE